MMAAHRALVKMRLGALTRFLPIADLRAILPEGLSPKAAREWAVLDTFDMFSPEYDNPQRCEAVAAMFRRSGAKVSFRRVRRDRERRDGRRSAGGQELDQSPRESRSSAGR